MVLLNCRTALVSSLVVKRKNDHITMQWCETPGWFSVHRRFGPTRVVVWRTSIPFTAPLGKYKKTFKMSGQCTTLSKCQNREIIELPVGLAVLPQRSTGGRHSVMRVMAYCHNLISEELHVVVFPSSRAISASNTTGVASRLIPNASRK